MLAPDASPMALRELVGWFSVGRTTLVVGHQPTLGQVVAQLMGLHEGECAIKKEQSGGCATVCAMAGQTVLVTVQSPDMVDSVPPACADGLVSLERIGHFPAHALPRLGLLPVSAGPIAVVCAQPTSATSLI